MLASLTASSAEPYPGYHSSSVPGFDGSRCGMRLGEFQRSVASLFSPSPCYHPFLTMGRAALGSPASRCQVSLSGLPLQAADDRKGLSVLGHAFGSPGQAPMDRTLVSGFVAGSAVVTNVDPFFKDHKRVQFGRAFSRGNVTEFTVDNLLACPASTQPCPPMLSSTDAGTICLKNMDKSQFELSGMMILSLGFAHQSAHFPIYSELSKSVTLALFLTNYFSHISSFARLKRKFRNGRNKKAFLKCVFLLNAIVLAKVHFEFGRHLWVIARCYK